MADTDQNQPSKEVNLLARRHGWPLIGDPHLRFVTPQLKTALAVWQTRRGSRKMPSRNDLTLRDLKTVLPNLAFLNIVRDEQRTRFKVRLAGGALDDFLSGPPTGRFIDEVVPPHFAEKWTALWEPTISAREPLRTVARVEFPSRRYYVSEALYAPLADDGEAPDALLIVVYFHGNARDDLASQLMGEIGDQALLATAS